MTAHRTAHEETKTGGQSTPLMGWPLEEDVVAVQRVKKEQHPVRLVDSEPLEGVAA